jgi:hypothetical protein
MTFLLLNRPIVHKRPANFRVGHLIFGSLRTIGETFIETLEKKEKKWKISPGWKPEKNSSTPFAGKTYIHTMYSWFETAFIHILLMNC